MTQGEATVHTARMEAQAVEIPGPRDPTPDAQDAPSVCGVMQNGAPVGRGNTLSECKRPCPRCGRPLLGAADLAARADAVRAIIEGCVALGLTRPGGALADAYGGDVREPLQGAVGAHGEARKSERADHHAFGFRPRGFFSSASLAR